MALVLLAPIAIIRRCRKNGLAGIRPFIWPSAKRLASRPTIWIHAVSVGETNAVRDLVRHLQSEYSESHEILLTNTTRSARAFARSQFNSSVHLEHLPYDAPWSIDRFIRRADPDLVILVESEIWPNLVHRLTLRGTPLLVLNGRISRASARRFVRFSILFRPSFQALAAVGAVSRTHEARYRFLGARNATTTGNLKFDRAPDNEQVRQGTEFRERLLHAKPKLRILLCASTRPGEEAALLEHLGPNRLNDTLLVVVPRHPERSSEAVGLLRKRGFVAAKRSEWPEDGSPTAMVGDTLGEMSFYYSAADVAVVGGSLLPYGGQNPHEPMMLGKPVVVGPHCGNFSEYVAGAHKHNAICTAKNSGEAVDAALGLLDDLEKARELGDAGLSWARSFRGATSRSLALVHAALPPFNSSSAPE